jgi:hypothetical protein
MTTAAAAFSPVTITGATAQSLHRRYGYSKVVYRLSATVPDAWLAGFDEICQADVDSWPSGCPTAHADRIEVMLADREHADRPALATIKAHLEATIAAANQRYGQHSSEVLASGAQEVAWEQQVLTSLQTALDEQFPG